MAAARRSLTLAITRGMNAVAARYRHAAATSARRLSGAPRAGIPVDARPVRVPAQPSPGPLPQGLRSSRAPRARARAGKGRAPVYAGVPAAVSKALDARAWAGAALELLGGKGGGKPTSAQGQGPGLAQLPQAMQAAEAFARAALA